MSGLNRFFRWFQPDKPEQPSQAHIVWSNVPPPPIESVHLPLPAPYSILDEAEAIAADAYRRAWGKPAPAPLAKTQPLVQRADAHHADALRAAVAGRGPAADTSIIFMADRLPLMVEPYPNEVWLRAARVSIQNALAAMPAQQRERFRRIRATALATPDILSVEMSVAYPMSWGSEKVLRSNLVPHLAGVAVMTLDLPPSLIAECDTDKDATNLFTAMGETGWWSVCIRVDGDGDDGERMAA